MSAGTPHTVVAQFIHANSVLKPVRREPGVGGAEYQVLTVGQADGSTLELWVAVEKAPPLAAQLASRPQPSAELGTSQPPAGKGEVVRTSLRPGDAAAWRMLERGRELDVCSPGDAVADSSDSGARDKAVVLAEAAAAEARWEDDGTRRRTRTVGGRTWVLSYLSDDDAAEGWYLAQAGGSVSVWMRTTSRADATERADERIATAGGAR